MLVFALNFANPVSFYEKDSLQLVEAVRHKK